MRTPRWWEEPRPNRPGRAWPRADLALAGVTGAAALVEVVARRDLDVSALALGLALALAVAARRTLPLAAVALAFGAFTAADLLARLLGQEPTALATGIVVLLLVRDLFRWGSGRELAVGSLVVAAGFAAVAGLGRTTAEEWVGGAAVLLCAALIGFAGRARSQARVSLVSHVRAQEREHLARELHDTVAHHLSAITVQAQAGRVLLANDASDGAAQALGLIEEEASRTLNEMRTMVGILRGAGEEAQAHRLRDLQSLATTSATLPVTVDLDDRLAGLSPALESALFRVAQESVTNAHRHARHATVVEIVSSAEPPGVRLVISDDGAPVNATRPGYGVMGMQERVRLLGGTLTAGPGPGGGWRVVASLPLVKEGE